MQTPTTQQLYSSTKLIPGQNLSVSALKYVRGQEVITRRILHPSGNTALTLSNQENTIHDF